MLGRCGVKSTRARPKRALDLRRREGEVKPGGRSRKEAASFLGATRVGQRFLESYACTSIPIARSYK
jgi:hypothetical protein